MSTVTNNLKLRIADSLTADARFNLTRIDTLGSSTLIDNQGNLNLRARANVNLLPNSGDIGGTGTGGTVAIGEAGNNITLLDIHATNIDLDSASLNIESGLLKFTDNTNFVAFTRPTSFTGDTTWELPGDDGSSGQVLTTDGAGVLSWGTVAGSSLNSANVEVGSVGNIRTAVDTSAAGDILADSTNGFTIKAGAIVDADINSNAAIATDKLAAVTASRALTSDASGFIEASAVTSTELGYLSGVTSSIQSQIDSISGANQTTADWTTADGTSKTITHGFGTRNVAVQVLDADNNFVTIEVESITRPNDNDVVLVSNEAPSTSWRVLVFQIGS